MQEALNRRADEGTERTVMNRAVDWNENQAEDGGQIAPLQGLAGRVPALQGMAGAEAAAQSGRQVDGPTGAEDGAQIAPRYGVCRADCSRCRRDGGCGGCFAERPSG